MKSETGKQTMKNCETCFVTIRQRRFIGKVVRDPNTHPPKKVLTAWYNSKRPTGAPIITNKRPFVKSLKILLPEIMGKNNYGNLNRWIVVAMVKQIHMARHFRTRTVD